MEQIFQAINVYFAFAAVVINAAFVVLVLVRTSRAPVYITFLFMCVSAIIWNFGIFMTYFAGRGFWFYFALIGSPMMPALMFHLIHALTKPSSPRAWTILAYVLSGLLSISSFLAIFQNGIRRFVDSSYWNVYFIGVLFPFIIGGVIMLIRAIRNAPSSEEKNRLRYILFAAVIGTAMGFTDLIQIFKISVPKLGHVGSVIYSSVFAVGIFRHRRAYDILAQMQLKLELLSEMATGIAHELRNPLSSLKGASKLLVAELDRKSNTVVQDYADVITEEVERLDAILANFQHLTRPLILQKEPVSINELIQKTVKLTDIGALPMKISQDLAADLPVVPADASALKQVFLNLIKNASEAGEDCTLVIKTARAPYGVNVSFRDSGRGMPPELADRIFEPFFTTKPSGMGMGLSICRRIVQAHQGEITVKSAVPGRTVFQIFLPA